VYPLIEQLINGIVIGSMYALVALGYTLVFGYLNKLNLAHGDIFMFGGFVAVFVLANGFPLWIAAIAVIFVSGLMGLLVEWLSFRKFNTNDAHITASLSSVALGIVITDVTQRIWGTEPISLNLPSSIYVNGFTLFGDTKITYVQLGILFISLLLMAGLTYVVHRTKYGRFMRAISEDTVSSSLLGIDAKKVMQQTFFISSALAGVAGILFVLRTGIASSTIGLTFGLKALAVMAIGGLGDLRGSLVAGLAIGIIEALAFHFGLGSISEMLVWVFLILILIFKPSGLFGSQHQLEVRA
jgi:branched-chain amino acid transport system permease protein